MTSKYLSVIFVFISFFFLSSCSHEAQQMKALTDVDSLMLTDADSAKSVLKGMSKEMNGASDEVKTYYHLLQVKAADKTFTHHRSDSLICSVADYYEKNGNLSRLPETYYYIGRVNVDLQNSEKALFYLQKAMAQDSTYLSPHLRGCICAQIGYIYLRNALFDEAKGMQEIAYGYLKEDGDTLFMRYCLEDMRTIDSLRARMVVDSASINAAKLRIMRVNDKLHSVLLRDQNNILQSNMEDSNRRHSIVEIAIIVFVAVAAAFALFFVRRKRVLKSDILDKTPSDVPQPVMTKRLFYDKEISELLSAHIKQNKVLKPADWKLIEERLLAEFPGFKDKLYSLYNLSETEYHTCLLIKLEVAPSNMAKLMATSNSSISQNRLRMQQKVFNGVGTAKDWDNYVMSL